MLSFAVVGAGSVVAICVCVVICVTCVVWCVVSVYGVVDIGVHDVAVVVLCLCYCCWCMLS